MAKLKVRFKRIFTDILVNLTVVLVMLFPFVLVGGLAYIIWHFISKLW